MFARVFNKYSLSFLSLAAVSAGLLSCGGSGDSGEGTCLPSGSRLNMVVPITDQVNLDNASSLIIQLDGNDTDLPLAKIQGAAAGTSIPATTHMVYRRTTAEKLLWWQLRDCSGPGHFAWSDCGDFLRLRSGEHGHHIQYLFKV